MSDYFSFTKTTIKALRVPKSGKDYYKDTKEKGLSLYITSTGHVTFFIRKRVNGKDERIILGNFPEIGVEEAREKALKVRVQVSEGKHPNEEKNKLRHDITFGEMFEQFMERYSKKHKRSWIYDEREVNRFLPHWFKRKASSISKQEVQLLHEKVREENGLYQANRILERVRAIYNKSIGWEWSGTNPALGIKKFKEKSRDRFIQPDELPRFFQALKEEGNSTVRDYIWISLLTGARKSNVLSMRWNEISFSRKEWRIPETKNDEPLTIPLTEEAIEILLDREKDKINEFVFPSEKSSKGFVQDPKKSWQRILKKAAIEDLRIHDLRRTLGSYQVAIGSSLPIIGKSLGHKSSKATEVYARLNLDPIRESVKKATSVMLSFIDK